jgi:protein-disulfide isomerase
MASRKELKQEARERRQAQEAQAARAATRRRRLGMLAAAVAAAAVVVVVAIVVSSGGGGGKGGVSGALLRGAQARTLVAGVDGTLGGAEQSGARLGRASAPVSMAYFGDLQCPVCRTFTEDALDQVIAAYVVPGRLKITYRSLETATQDPSTFSTQQVAALAAGRQNRLWQYVELFYRQQGTENSGYVTEAFLRGVAAQVPGLDVARWQADRRRAALADQVRADTTAAGIAGADATPTLVVTGPRGSRSLTGAVPFAEVRSAIDAVA